MTPEEVRLYPFNIFNLEQNYKTETKGKKIYIQHVMAG